MSHVLRLCVLLVGLSLAQGASAQSQRLEFKWLPDASGDKKWRPEVGFDSNRSYFNDRTVKFLGLRLGAEHRGVHRFGLAFYGLTRPESYYHVNTDFPDAAEDQEVQYSADYLALFYERVILEAGKWELSVPLSLGAGSLNATYKDNRGNYIPYLESGFSVLGTGHMLKYELLPWLEPAIGSGIRLILNAEPEVVKTLNKPYFILKVSVKLGVLYKMASKSLK